uniref:Variant surface glycoprotein 1246 n=1 Tax=Trypanosoma brucei TaxID=5691 RepID=M4SY12_9TRYP|nr:variant surface glycoprotein 1246 [Trypanosoma brucei]
MDTTRWNLLLVATFLIAALGMAEDTDKGANGEDYAALCTLLNLADSIPNQPAETDGTSEVATALAAINLTLSDATFKSIAISNKDKDHGNLPAELNEKKKGWEKHWPLWKKAADVLTGEKNRVDHAAWNKHADNAAIKAKVAAAAEAAATLAGRRQSLLVQRKEAEIVAELNKAKYGVTGEDKTTIFVAGKGNRAKLCSGTGEASANIAGTALKVDIMCLCAKHTDESANGAKACCPSCNTNNNAWTPTTEAQQAWTTFKQNCAKLQTKQQLTSSALEAAMAQFATRLHKPRHTDGSQLFVLGFTHGTFNNGCTGQAGSGFGKCVQYPKKYFDGSTEGIPWASSLRKAARILDNQKQLNQELKALNEAANLINLTTSNLIHEHRKSTTGHEQQAGDKTQATTKTEECSNAKENKDECKKLEEKGCTFNTDLNKCELKKEIERKTRKRKRK